MIRFTQGDLLEADTEALVNTVNTVGTMGAGIALLFKQRFPANYRAYRNACQKGEVRVGQMFVTAGVEQGDPRWIINFPTKEHWSKPTKLEWVASGLVALRAVIQKKRIGSVAIPALGCGHGGLEWKVVRPMIQEALMELQGVNVIIYEPLA